MKLPLFPYIKLPEEFLALLKSNLAPATSMSEVFEVIRPNRGLNIILENAFKELDDGRGLEKTISGLGWPAFRERLGSVYIYKTIYGNYPNKIQLNLVDEIKHLENTYQDHSIHGVSRLFLLGFYLKLANIEIQNSLNNQFVEIKIPQEISSILKLSQGRSERIDWLILIAFQLSNALGTKVVTNAISSGKKLEDLYQMMETEQREEMLSNLMSYGASIKEQDIFLYDKI